jgi:hypothetical protein
MISFKKQYDPLVSLGVGQRALITKWLDEMGVENYTIKDDLTIDVDGHVYLHSKNLDKFPSYIKFGKVRGYFDCDDNQLVSLEGSPMEVGNGFYCGSNQLVSLEGSPMKVGNNFWCYNNKVQFTKEEVKNVCKVKYNIYV